ncbi:MAG: COX15/CtaA family protein [SAR324 cluster bacterium]|nr:COX15/CtaA family protein [SAR324 cluster bacterium]MBL7034574.1 COX15/CtaA family protein [SAR324 cluster bacterium]
MKWLCLGAALLTWPLIPFGAFVRLKNAGLSCPDWPLCYGQFIPPPGYEIALETGHRLVAVILGFLIIAITILTFRQDSYFQHRKPVFAGLIIVFIQGILGALTVTMVLWPPIVTLHLLGGNLLFGILVYLARVTFLDAKGDSSNCLAPNTNTLASLALERRQLYWMLAVLFVIIGSGGYNSTTSSGTHCEAFPGCHEESYLSFGMSGTDISAWSGIEDHKLPQAPLDFRGRFLPEYENEWIHMLHRLIAVSGALFLLLMSWRWLKNRHGDQITALSIILLILLEICIGIINAVLRVPAPISALHTAIAATLTGIIFFTIAGNHHKRKKYE